MKLPFLNRKLVLINYFYFNIILLSCSSVGVDKYAVNIQIKVLESYLGWSATTNNGCLINTLSRELL